MIPMLSLWLACFPGSIWEVPTSTSNWAATEYQYEWGARSFRGIGEYRHLRVSFEQHALEPFITQEVLLGTPLRIQERKHLFVWTGLRNTQLLSEHSRSLRWGGSLFYETSELTKSFLYVDCDQSLEYRIVQLYCPDPKWSMGIGWEEDQSALDPLFFQLNFSNAPHAIHLQQRGSKTTLGYSLSGGNWTLQIQIASGIYQPKSTVLWQAQN